MPPTQAAALAQEAAEAYRRCKHVLPPSWQELLRRERANYLAVHPFIQAHFPRSPHSWQPAIYSQHMLQVEAGLVANEASSQTLPKCDACHSFTVGLRRCAGCKVKKYVSARGAGRQNDGSAR